MQMRRSQVSSRFELVLVFLLFTMSACINTRSFSDAKSAQLAQSDAIPPDLFLAGIKGEYRRIKPLRARELNQPVETPVLKLTAAKVVLADYALLIKDFPAVRKIASTRRESSEIKKDIDAWIVQNFAYISETQVLETPDMVIQSPIPAEKKRSTHVKAYRPHSYGRALVLELNKNEVGRSQSYLIDVKGAGAKSPHSTGNGLARLGEAIREFAIEKMMNAIFTDANKRALQRNDKGWFKLGTNGIYAVLDAGFDVRNVSYGKEDNGFPEYSPAGLIARRAHKRLEAFQVLQPVARSDANSNSGSDEYGEADDDEEIYDDEDVFDELEPLDRIYQLLVHTEKVLRQYGVMSIDASYPNPAVDVTNLQLTTKDEVVDMGGILVDEKFTKPILFHELNPGKFDPSEFAKIDALRRVPFEDWGYSRSKVRKPMFDNVWIKSHELADRLKSGGASGRVSDSDFARLRNETESYVSGILQTVKGRLSQ